MNGSQCEVVSATRGYQTTDRIAVILRTTSLKEHKYITVYVYGLVGTIDCKAVACTTYMLY